MFPETNLLEKCNFLRKVSDSLKKVSVQPGLLRIIDRGPRQRQAKASDPLRAQALTFCDSA